MKQVRKKIPIKGLSSITLIDSLPTWAKVVFVIAGGISLFYSAAHNGFGETLLHAIFSP